MRPREGNFGLSHQLVLTALHGIPPIQPGDNLAEIILPFAPSPLPGGESGEMGEVFVIAQKIVSKAEGRMVNLAQVRPSQQAIQLAERSQKDPRLCHLILSESAEVLRVRPGLIVVEHKQGFVCANAGIDHSNVEGGEDWVLLLPEDGDASARRIRDQIQARTGRPTGVLIIDSHGRAWRNGTVGITIGIAGLPGLVDMRGQPDMNGRTLLSTQVGVADELAAAASLIMGQAAEGTPVVHVRGFPYALRESTLTELIRDRQMDLFR